MDTYLFLIRHGATANNQADPPILQGRKLDPELSEEGRRQAGRTAKLLSGRPIGRVVASPLLRSRQTAHILAEPHGLEVEIVQEITEVDVGAWEGRNWGEIEAEDPEAYRRFMADPTIHGYADGESFLDVQRRVSPAIERMLLESTGRQIVVVGHNAVNRSYLAGLLGLPPARVRDVRQANCGVNVIRRRNDKTELISYNSTFHLDG